MSCDKLTVFQERKDCNYWGDTHPHLYELVRRDLVHKMQSGSYGKALERPLSASSCGDADICVAIHIRWILSAT